MSEEKQVFDYDEDEAVVFIQNHLPEEMKNKFSDDEINYVIDLIYDFYESEGLFDGDDDDDIEIELEKLMECVVKSARKDNIRDFSDNELESIVAGELAYCDTLDIFE